MRHALREALEVTDIALPSFDDEATLWDDVDPEEAAKRISDAGVQEIAVKSGPAAVALFNEGTLVRVPPRRSAIFATRPGPAIPSTPVT